MLCGQCQRDKPEKDFIKSDLCYSCLYKNKLSLINEKAISEEKKCKICNTVIENERLIYWKSCYCSPTCAKQGKCLYNKNYWIRKCNSLKITGGFQYGKSK